jgi:AraC family transcriptional regulator, regulatory protein of adaptative response / DNA-3-methyladenine glycosylase II
MDRMVIDSDAAYRALQGRDARFDGVFFAAVSTTGIYCRPSCPARTPQRSNVSFLPTSAAAQRAGYRACKRCRPDATPGSADWNSRADLVARAVRLIADGVIDRDGVTGLADQLGYSERQVGRAVTAELGAPPLALARAQRAQTARILLENTDLPAAEVAFAAGFGSVRQFNDTMTSVFASTPSELRSRNRSRPVAAGSVKLRLPYRAPMELDRTLDFLAGRMIAGVERYDATGYHRTLRLPYGPALVSISDGHGYVLAELRLTDQRDLAAAVARIRRWLDLDADPVAVDRTLSALPQLRDLVVARPGLRAVASVDGFEMAMRAVVGQQISVAAARTHLSTLVSRHGDDAGLEGWRLFPRPEVIAALDPTDLPMPRARGRTVIALATAMATGDLDLTAGADRDRTRAALLRLPGIGEWTTGYLMMRALGDPDVYLGTDLIIKRQAALLPGLDIGRAAPWRSYLTHQLWARYLDGLKTNPSRTTGSPRQLTKEPA